MDNNIENIMCPICLSDIDKNDYILYCKHSYHKDCIAKWIHQYNNYNADNFATCPICRCRIENNHSLKNEHDDGLFYMAYFIYVVLILFFCISHYVNFRPHSCVYVYETIGVTVFFLYIYMFKKYIFY